ncbi:aliphatic sulfonate ABC transporter substrate-binding protein [Acidovorax sp. CCYZU-2555]|uniref:aliphatic sulfonate ABC transporter substrate-binding protein n=1 Tax=Acidovorax sp. CCYZU-2555 TaxID=2835042 RepID=UPI001BCD5311|nr:aliphatic sulfonate ABC transporter substrate-binding protein [Acidovorax sp. CCYZU-2555]MBS7778232.1 aliphatic sulfonate ABC transporter substrate-binding protein [Acidovorax sp. CCYZU-2555]
MTSRRQFNAGLLALAATGFPTLGQAQQAAPKEFKIGWQKGSVIMVLAKHNQVFEKRLKTLGVDSVKWVEFQFGPPLLEGLGVGAVDIGAVGDTPPIFAQVAGAKVAYVATTPSSLSAILVPKDSPIKTVADLKGKRVAFGRGSSAHAVTVRALAHVGLTLKDIEPVYLSPADATAAFNGGRVDAWTVWDPYFAIAQQRYNARVLIDTTAAHLSSHSYYLANRDTAQKYPVVLSAVLEEIGKLIAWAGNNRKELAEFYAKETGVELESTLLAFQRAPYAWGPVTETHVRLQRELATSFYELGIVPKKVDPKEILWKATAL